MPEEIYPELSDDGEAINRNRDALKLRLDWLIDQTWREYEAGDASRAPEFVEQCDIVARFADGAASVLNEGVYSHSAFTMCRDEANAASANFGYVGGTDPDNDKAYMYAGWEQCKKAYGALSGI